MGDTYFDELQPLLDRLAAGDEAAREDLLGYAYQRLRQMARSELVKFPIIGRTCESGDIAHDVYLRLRNALKKLATQERSPPTVADFFRLAAWHIRCDLLNLASKRREQDPSGPTPTASDTTAPGLDPPYGSAGPSTLAEWAEVHAAIARLPDQDRAMFDLIYYGGLSQAEAAQVLGVCTKTAQRQWIIARLALKRELKGQFPSL